MKYMTEFRDFAAAQALSQELHAECAGLDSIRIMEVCGGHTAAIFKFGIRDLLPKNIVLMSGPGCPVCVTSNSFLDYAIALSRQPDVTIASFGDLLRVPGSRSSLLQEKSRGADVRICYSSLDALELARKNPSRKVVFLGIGFETTAPTVAAAIQRASLEGLNNFLVLSALKTMPNAMRALLESGELGLNAFICPGHVSTVTGLGIYDFIAREFHTPCVVTGFEPLDLLQSILMIVRQLKEKRAVVENQYTRATSDTGNRIAQALIGEVFQASDVEWRGLGVIPGSGLGLNDRYAEFDAVKKIPLQIESTRENPGCICGSIMRGVKTPNQCKLFGTACRPDRPQGSCMVSDEGHCATYFKYAPLAKTKESTEKSSYE